MILTFTLTILIYQHLDCANGDWSAQRSHDKITCMSYITITVDSATEQLD